MLRSLARPFHSSVPRLSAFADFPLPKDVPLASPTPICATATAPVGLRLGTIDTHVPTASISLVIPAGARFESLDHQGVSHYLANYAYKYTSTSTPLRMAREIELRGMKVNTTVDREFMVYQAQFLRDDLAFALETLSDVIYNTKFNHWEFNQVANQVSQQASEARTNATITGYELAHRLAFRHGLGNSLYAPAFPSITNDIVAQFAKVNLAIGSNAALFGVGVNPDELNQLSAVHFSQASGSPVAKVITNYFGGETRVDLPHGHNVTVAFPGAAIGTAEATVLSVLTTLLGDGSKYVKWGTEAGSPLVCAGRKAHAAVKAFHASYSDAGLFGLSSTCKTSPVNSTNGITQAITALKSIASGKVDSKDITRAINQAKTNILFAAESPATFARLCATHLAINGNFIKAQDSAATLDKVTLQDVSKAAQKILSAKPSVVVAGNATKLPYVDNLGL